MAEEGSLFGGVIGKYAMATAAKVESEAQKTSDNEKKRKKSRTIHRIFLFYWFAMALWYC